MATTIGVVKPISQMHFAPGSVVTIPNVTWQKNLKQRSLMLNFNTI